MKTFATLIRHSITWLFGLFITWLAIYLSGDDLTAAKDALAALVEPLVIIAGFVGVIVARLAMPFFNRIFRMGSGERRDDDEGAGSAGGLVPLLLLCLGIAALLPGCADFPITGKIVGPGGSVTYSPEVGLGVEIDTRSSK
jgi:hypothetical protein